ncbi:MAG: PIN domain-containing protein [Armatimonadetes bacterium]|nr:PIN domain-containing protein [Armatimonadota bacterium]
MTMPIREAVFVDTWGWIALGYRQDAFHGEIVRYYESLRHENIPIHTSDYILDEVITLLFRRSHYNESVRFIEGILAAAALGQVQIETITSERFGLAWELRKRFHDKPGISFTDLTSMVVMQERGLYRVLTQDEHSVQVGMGLVRIP